MKKLKPKEPLLALLLACLFPGLGQVYAGQTKRGIKFFCLLVVLPLIPILYLLHPQTGIPAVLGYAFLAMLGFLVILSFVVLVDAYKCAKSFNRHRNIKITTSRSKKFWLIIYIIFFLFVFNPSSLVGLYVKTSVIQAFKIPVGSMMPTLIAGDRIICNKLAYKKSAPKRGDVIIFKFPENPKIVFIKRLVGFPGETLEIRSGQIIINGKTLKEPKAITQTFYHNRGEYGQEEQAITIPEDSYFCLGDNSYNSRDSRYWGFVPKKNLIGKAYKIYWPFDRSGPIE
ncbi:MAG: signal peptidase I [Candidatus Omnitrophota bacterium]